VIVRVVRALAVAALAVAPITALAAPSPGPATLRAALADPIDRSFVEADVGAAGTLEGPFDAESYVNYYELSGLDGSGACRAMALSPATGGSGTSRGHLDTSASL